jgi:glyoxylase-like metal-dependent hydrolase (beta-lactamase superfamily II)
MVGPRADARYGLFPDFHITQYARSIRSLLELDFDTFVPGRGPVMQKAELERAIDYAEALSEAVQRAFAEGVPIWIYEMMAPYVSQALQGQFGDLEGFEAHVGIGAMRFVHHYLMGGWGIEDTHEPEQVLAA